MTVVWSYLLSTAILEIIKPTQTHHNVHTTFFAPIHLLVPYQSIHLPIPFYRYYLPFSTPTILPFSAHPVAEYSVRELVQSIPTAFQADRNLNLARLRFNLTEDIIVSSESSCKASTPTNPVQFFVSQALCNPACLLPLTLVLPAHSAGSDRATKLVAVRNRPRQPEHVLAWRKQRNPQWSP